jgi:hypothetical protein
MILGDKPLIFEVVLSQQGRTAAQGNGETIVSAKQELEAGSTL